MKTLKKLTVNEMQDFTVIERNEQAALKGGDTPYFKSQLWWNNSLEGYVNAQTGLCISTVDVCHGSGGAMDIGTFRYFGVSPSASKAYALTKTSQGTFFINSCSCAVPVGTYYNNLNSLDVTSVINR